MLMKLIYETKLNGSNHESLAPLSTEWTEYLAGEVQKRSTELQITWLI